MLRIRFFRVGKKHQPSFKIVVTDKRNPPQGGRFLEEVGSYNPLTKEKILRPERVKFWLERGAQPSDRVHNLLIEEKVVAGLKRQIHKKAMKKAEAPPAPAEAKKEEKKETLREESTALEAEAGKDKR